MNRNFPLRSLYSKREKASTMFFIVRSLMDELPSCYPKISIFQSEKKNEKKKNMIRGSVHLEKQLSQWPRFFPFFLQISFCPWLVKNMEFIASLDSSSILPVLSCMTDNEIYNLYDSMILFLQSLRK